MPPTLVVAREARSPVWAVLAPLFYLFACALSVRAISLDPSADIGVPGLLLAVGLVPAFVIPGVFTTRKVLIAACEDGLLVDGRAIKLNDARVQLADRGAAMLHVETRNGESRTFLFTSSKDAQHLAAGLPPISAPAGALVA
jgi:hypothetical protein